MKILYGYDIPKSYFNKIADLDSEVFCADADDFGGDTTMPKENIISLLEKNISTTVIAIDDNDNVIAYYQGFPMEPEFEKKYLAGEADFKELDGSKIMDSSSKNINLYLWTVAIKKEYQAKKVPDPNEPGVEVPIIKLLYEGLVSSIVDLKKQGTTIKKVYGEAVSKKGVKIMESFCGKEGLMHADEENEFYLFGSDFDVNCEAFSRCRNVEELKKAYATHTTTKEVLSGNLNLLKNSTKLEEHIENMAKKDL